MKLALQQKRMLNITQTKYFNNEVYSNLFDNPININY